MAGVCVLRELLRATSSITSSSHGRRKATSTGKKTHERTIESKLLLVSTEWPFGVKKPA
jgi:hypothetical protein